MLNLVKKDGKKLMKTQEKMAKNKGIVGQIFLAGDLLKQATEIEIQPVEFPIVAITLRIALQDEPTDLDPILLSHAVLELIYKNPLLQKDRYFDVNFIDSGIVDTNGTLTLILFFKGKSKLDPKHQIVPSIIQAKSFLNNGKPQLIVKS